MNVNAIQYLTRKIIKVNSAVIWHQTKSISLIPAIAIKNRTTLLSMPYIKREKYSACKERVQSNRLKKKSVKNLTLGYPSCQCYFFLYFLLWTFPKGEQLYCANRISNKMSTYNKVNLIISLETDGNFQLFFLFWTLPFLIIYLLFINSLITIQIITFSLVTERKNFRSDKIHVNFLR